MDKYTIIEYPNRVFERAEVFLNSQPVCTINLFYEVTPDWILIYETDGGQGIGFRQGRLKRKIFIGDAELTVETKII